MTFQEIIFILINNHFPGKFILYGGIIVFNVFFVCVLVCSNDIAYIAGMRKKQSMVPQDIFVERVVVCSQRRLCSHCIQQRGIGAANTVAMKIQTAESSKALYFLFVKNGALENDAGFIFIFLNNV